MATHLKSLEKKAKLDEGHAKAARVYKARVAFLTSEWVEPRDRVQRMTEDVATPEPDPTRLANPNRNPGDARSKSLIKSLFIFRVIKFLFSKVSRLETPT